jgi:hypothetical protein
MLTEAKLILPNVHAADEVEPLLVDLAGGFTRMRARGAWRDPATSRTVSEGVRIYLMSAEWTEGQKTTLEYIAQAAAKHLGQSEVMVTFPDSGALFVAPDGVVPATHAGPRIAQ